MTTPVIGIIGATQHGKTTLALSLLNYLRLRDEAKISPNLFEPYNRFAHIYAGIASQWFAWSSPRSDGVLVDCALARNPQNSDTWAAIDAAVLVIAVGQPFNRDLYESILFARQACVNLVVFLSHCDEATETQVDQTELVIRQLLHECDLPGDDVVFVRGDARVGAPPTDVNDPLCRPLGEVLSEVARIVVHRRGDRDAPLLLPIGNGLNVHLTIPPDVPRSHGQRYSLRGRIEQGVIRTEDTVELTMSNEVSMLLRVAEMSRFNETLTEAGPGECVRIELALSPACQLESLPPYHPNAIVAAPGAVRLKKRFRAHFRVFRTSERGKRSLRSASKPTFWLGACHSKGLVTLDGPKSLLSGEVGEGNVLLDRGCLLRKGQLFVCRHRSGAVAAGEILEVR